MSRHIRYQVPIDERTNESLEILKAEQNSPKNWIVRRLVEQEIARVRKAKGSSSNNKKSLEVAAR